MSSVALFPILNTTISYGLICTMMLDAEETDHIEVSSLYVREQPNSFIINNLKSILLPVRQQLASRHFHFYFQKSEWGEKERDTSEVKLRETGSPNEVLTTEAQN